MRKSILYFLLISLFSCSPNLQESKLVLDVENPSLKLINGTLFYNENPFYGKITQFNSVNKTYDLAEYIAGKKEGEEVKTYENGSVAEQRFYTKGLKTGVHKAWWQNGQQKFELHFNDKGEYNGSVKEWYKNGQQFKDFNYKNGKEAGPQRMWQSNGKIRANFVTKNGERFGLIGLKKCYSVNTKNEEFK